MIKPFRLGLTFGAAFFIFGDATTGKLSIGAILGRNGSTVVEVSSLVDGWNQLLFSVVEPISDWEANGSTVWNGSTSSIVGRGEVVVEATGNEEDGLFKSSEVISALNWSKLAENKHKSFVYF